MIISVLFAGLGNQLFQYAVGRAVAERQGTGLLLDATRFAYVRERGLDLPELKIRARLLPNGLAKLLEPGGGANRFKAWAKRLASRGCPSVVDQEAGYDERVFEAGRTCRLDGYWQSARYFEHLRPQLLAELELRDGLPPPLAAFARRVEAEESVAVHVRRGDLVANAYYAATTGALGAGYYAEALTRLQARLPAARIYVFSDDPAWCQQHLPSTLPTEIVSGNVTRSALEDLMIMKRCRHFVIANSTFSWWAAWLGCHPAKQVIAPTHSSRQARGWQGDLVPATWETLDPAFEAVVVR